MNNPKYVQGIKCEKCGSTNTVTLKHESNKVTWCECGAVFVITEDYTLMVHDFAETVIVYE